MTIDLGEKEVGRRREGDLGLFCIDLGLLLRFIYLLFCLSLLRLFSLFSLVERRRPPDTAGRAKCPGAPAFNEQ